MGSQTFTEDLGFEKGMSKEEIAAKNPISNSPYMDDSIINQHPRFPTFTKNVRLRRGANPPILQPIFVDINTDT